MSHRDEFDSLILISTDSENSEDEDHNKLLNSTLKHSGAEFEANINMLKSNNTLRLKTRWDDIIRKYSAIDDDLESDEIDLSTGQITKDNGHLRSLASTGTQIDGVKIQTNLWAGDYDFDKLEREERRVEEDRKRRKQKLKQQLKMELRFHNASFASSDFLEPDDSSSPTKKQKLRKNQNPFLIDSDFKHLSSPLSSPVKLFSSPDALRLREDLESPTKPKGRRMKGYSNHFESPFRCGNSDFATSVLPQGLSRSSPIKKVTGGHDVDSLLMSISDLFEYPDIALFSCAFRSCNFNSESKNLYRAHLLSQHVDQLHQIGYPVSPLRPDYERSHISELTILKLALHFPLEIEMPSHEPFKCSLSLGNSRTCQKLFLDQRSLSIHKQKHPKQCSTGRQVLPCPLLGCDFMTDESYFELTDHVQAHMKELKLKNPSKEYLPSEDWADPFSDTESSLDFSDDEIAKKTTAPARSSPKFDLSRPKLRQSDKNMRSSAASTLQNDLKFEIVDVAEPESSKIEEKSGYNSIDELFTSD